MSLAGLLALLALAYASVGSTLWAAPAVGSALVVGVYLALGRPTERPLLELLERAERVRPCCEEVREAVRGCEGRG